VLYVGNGAPYVAGPLTVDEVEELELALTGPLALALTLEEETGAEAE